MPPKIEKKNMASVAKLVSGVGPKTKKLAGQQTDAEKIREAQIKAGYNKYGQIKGRTVVTQGAGPEKLTATPRMRSISTGVATPQKPKQTTSVTPTPTRPQRTTTGQIKKVVTGGIKQDTQWVELFLHQQKQLYQHQLHLQRKLLKKNQLQHLNVEHIKMRLDFTHLKLLILLNVIQNGLN